MSSKMIGQVYKPSDCKVQMKKNFKEGLSKGSTTHCPEIDENFTWRRQEATILIGNNNEGKSLILKQLCLIKALEDKWKFVFNSPEDYPPESFFDDMVHTVSGKTTDKTYPSLIPDEEYDYIVDNLLEPYFDFIHLDAKDNTIENWLADAQRLHDIEPRDVYIGDPMLKFKRSKETVDMRDDMYAAFCDSLLTEFARKNDCIVVIVMHLVTPRLNEKGYYDKPQKFGIKGGSSWSDGIDNVLFMWRPEFAKDKLSLKVVFGSDKIKKQKLCGIPGEKEFSFSRKTNRYCYMNYSNPNEPGDPIFNFDKFMKPIRQKQ